MTANSNAISGFAAIFYNVLMPLNDLADFKMKFRAVDKSYMIDSPYWGSAVRIIIAHGALYVEGVSKTTKSKFLEERSRCDAYINMPMCLLLAFVNGQAGIFSVALRWLQGSVEVKGHFYLFSLRALFDFFKSSPPSDAR
jgi:hypothetical protein